MYKLTRFTLCVLLVSPIVLFPLVHSLMAYADFNLEELEQLEQLEQTELLQQAREAAKAWKFAEAERYLNEATEKSYAPQQLAEVEKLIADNRAAKAEKERREEEERQRLAALERQRQQAAAQASANYGLPKNMCYRVSGSYALHQYCNTGSCDGFYNKSYAQRTLCKNDDPSGFYNSNRETNIRLYLQNGGYLSYDYFSDKAAYQSGQFNGSFQERKNFILYLLNGITLIKY